MQAIQKNFMMIDFLSKTHQYISKENKAPYNKLCVILPSRRAFRTLETEFEGEKPDFFAIDDFVKSEQEYKNAEQITLLLTLQDILVEELEESDSLLSIVSVLLNDFNSIQQSRVDLKAFFAHLSYIKQADEWGLDESNSTIELWRKLPLIFEKFELTLKEQGLAYRGLLYRNLADNVNDLINHPKYDYFYFVGFNALTKSEEDLMFAMKAAGKAEMLFDSDTFYMNKKNKASKHLLKLKIKLPLEDWKWQDSILETSEKNISYIGNDNATLQAHTLQKLLKKWKKKLEGKRTCIVLPDENMLMPVLYALDHEVDISIGKNLRTSILFNLIDALFSMHQTSKTVYRSGKMEDEYLSEEETQKIESYFYKDIFKVLQHPFVKIHESKLSNADQSFIQDTIKYINKYNIVNMSAYQLRRLPISLMKLHDRIENTEKKEAIKNYYLQFGELLEILFGSWNGKTEQAIVTFEKICSVFGYSFMQGEHNENEYKSDVAHLEKIYIEKFGKILDSLRKAIGNRGETLKVNTLKTLLYQLFREQRIDFQSNKAENIHLIGMLETRALDFENVIILSCNEGTLPLTKHSNSLIPRDIANQYNIPTYEDTDAQVSYNFYRLLQRAENIALLYVNPSKTNGGKEKSRFLQQIKSFLLPKNPLIKFESLYAKLPSDKVENTPELIIEKTPEIIEIILKNLKNGLSASQLNTYLRCPLTYYFRYIAKIKEPDKVEEEIGQNIFGSLIHKVLEDVYAEIADADSKQKVGVKDLKEAKKTIEQRVQKTFEDDNKGYEMTGNNYIGLQMAIKQVKDFFDQQIAELKEVKTTKHTDYFKILGLEVGKGYREENYKEPRFNIKFEMPRIFFETQGQKVEVSIIGMVDRLDRKDGVVRIIDYKTGKMNKEDLDIKGKEIFVFDEKKDPSKARQLWLYAYIILKGMQNNEAFEIYKDDTIISSIYGTQSIKEGLMSLNDEGDTNLFEDKEAVIKQTEGEIIRITSEMLDPNIPFQRHDSLKPFVFSDMF